MKKNIVCSSDYERYRVILPLRTVFTRRQNTYIFEQLEKMHPCFSDDFSFDSKLRLGKKGFVSDVVVMNNLKLAQYKMRGNGKRLYLEECPDKRVFKGNLLGAKILGKTGALVLFILLAGLCVLFLTASRKIFNKKTFGRAEESFLEENSTVQESGGLENGLGMEVVPFECGEGLGKLLTILKKGKGTVSSLNYVSALDGERFEAAVNFFLPEKFTDEGFEISSVVYKSNEPFFTVKGVLGSSMKINDVVFVSGTGHGGGLGVGSELKIKPECFLGMRNILRKNGAEILEENQKGWSIKFALREAMLFRCERLISEISDFVEGNSFILRKLCFRKISEFDFECELCLQPNESGQKGYCLKDLVNYLPLFGLNNQKKGGEEALVHNLEVEPSADFERRLKIGEISHKDGKKTTFFKNSRGKIVVEKEYEK